MPRRRTDFRGLADPSRVRLLRYVQATPGCTVKALADSTGLHVNTVREHLQALTDEGLVTTETTHTGSRGRPATTYRPVVDPAHNSAARDRVRQAWERGDTLRRILPPDDTVTKLGEAALHQLDTLYQHLDDSGLEPVVDEEQLAVDLAPCPYYRFLDEDPELVCAMHAQLIRDTLAQAPGPLRLRELRPFVGPTTCIAQLHQVDDSVHHVDDPDHQIDDQVNSDLPPTEQQTTAE